MSQAQNRRQQAQQVAHQASKRIHMLMNMNNEAEQRALLAKLRRGVGNKPGELPGLWSILLDGLPKDMQSNYGEPTREEWAIYTSLTVYALHQQGRNAKQDPMHQAEVSLGSAANRLAGGSPEGRERVARRFNLVAMAAGMQEMNYYLRAFVQLLRAEHIALDYVMLAKDLYCYQFEDLASSVRLKWGQDFYAVKKDVEDEEEQNHA